MEELASQPVIMFQKKYTVNLLKTKRSIGGWGPEGRKWEEKEG